MDSIVLCADSESLRHPEMIGLEGVRLDDVPWLVTLSRAEEVRARARQDPMPQEFWIASADDMEAINIAAALKRDEPLRTIRLVVSDATGSVLSRAHAASVDEVLPLWRFAQRFRTETQRRAVMGMPAKGREEGGGGSGQARIEATGATAPATGVLSAPSEASVPVAAAVPVRSSPAIAGPVAAVPAAGEDDRTLVMAPLAKAVAAAAPVRTDGKSAFVLSVVSGSGGAGKTTVALYAALLAQAQGYATLLVDGDLQFGDLHTILDRERPCTVVDALQASDPLALLRPTEGELAFIAAPRKLEEAELCAPQLPRLIDAMAPHFDVVVVNTATSWTDYHAPLIDRSTRTLFLIDQRASSVRACQHAMDVCLRSGIATSSFLFALNRCSRHALFTSIDVSCALNGAHVIELKEGGNAVEEACSAGMAVELLGEKNGLCASLVEMLDGMLPQRPDEMRQGARSRGKARSREGAARGERRSARRGKHGKRERYGAAEPVPFEAPVASARQGA